MYAVIVKLKGRSADKIISATTVNTFRPQTGAPLMEYISRNTCMQSPALTEIQGLNQLPYSFYPHVDSITTMSRSIERAEFLPEASQVQLSWKNSFTDDDFQNASYDYAVIAVPFSKVRSWRFPNTCK